MKRRNLLICWVIFMVLVGTGCAPSTPENIVPTQASSTATVPAVTEIPSTETPVLVPTADLSMEIGSTHAYVDGSLLVAVPEGEFLMGGDPENPKHKVFLSDFWIYSTEVTNQQYSLCENLGECTPPDLNDNPSYADKLRANDPVVGVTHEQAGAYCSFVNGRLPTEAEWEKAARTTDSDFYPWGNAMPTCDLLNFNDCVGTTTNVINYKSGASLYGAMDMAGNVFEWVADWFDPDYYGVSPGENPEGPANGVERAVRSSSYISSPSQIAVINRHFENPQNHRPDLGFRCVVEDPTYFAPFCETPAIYAPSSQNSESSESCPTLDIEQAQFCSGNSPMTNIIFKGPPDAEIDFESCIPSGDPSLFTCQEPGTMVSITAVCQISLSGNPSCPPGFSLQDDICISKSEVGGQCLPGWNYEISAQCCTPGVEEDSTFSTHVCPVGTFYAEIQEVCLPYPVQGKVSVSIEVGYVPIDSCRPASSGGDASAPTIVPIVSPTASSSCPPQSCSVGIWDPDLCCCALGSVCY